MKNKKSNIIRSRVKSQESRRVFNFGKRVLSFVLVLSSWFINAQVTAEIDSTSIKIGEQITYKIQVETDTTNLVVFPEGQTFLPLEVIESYKTDTLKNKDKFNLIKTYGLTQFDSGTYTIPRQKIAIGDKLFFTDSMKVEVRNVLIDTTKQGLYDIKPIITVNKTGSNWFKYLLITLIIIAAVGFVLYWFIWRKKPLTQAEEIALLPPYDRAKLALKKLDDSLYLEHQNLKDYYSDLTFIIKKYLDEKVYDRALESTTDELIYRLNLLKDGNQIKITKEDIANLESILKRADLVKFAKSAPDVELAKLDRNTIDAKIDQVKEALPEPTEEEKLLDEQYKKELERKQKRNKIIATVAVGLFLAIATFVGFGLKYGFTYVKDHIFGHESKTLLEGNWVNSAYGFPPIHISTPQVLKRMDRPKSQELNQDTSVSTFSYGALTEMFWVSTSTSILKNPGEEGVDLEKISENTLQDFEAQGAKDIIVLKELFTTPNGAEGLKTHGTFKILSPISNKLQEGNYVMLHFTAENVLQQIIITSPKDDTYADQMVARILNSIELKEVEE